MRRLMLAVALTASLGGRVASAQPQQSTPVFRAGVDLVAVDVSVVDGEGRPVEGLRAEDFSLKVNGTPRAISSVEYIPQGAPVTDRAASVTGWHYSSNEGASVGRLIMLAVDESSLPPGDGKAVMNTAARFVDQLSPSDRIGLYVFPGTGPTIDFTAEHGVVRDGLSKINGKAEILDTTHNIGWSEAVAIDRGDATTLRDVIARECIQGSDLLCTETVEQEARQLSQHLMVQSRAAQGALRALLARMKEIDGTKTLILLSAGLLADYAQTEITALGEQALAAQVNIYVLRVEGARFDAARRRLSPTLTEDERIWTTGLETLAGSGRGAWFRITGDGTYAFNRIARELSGYYLLAFEPQGEQRGKRHKIDVNVSRRGATVRSRREFQVDSLQTHASDQSQLTALLRAPLLATKLPLRVTTYTYQDQRGNRLRTMICAQMDLEGEADAGAAIGYVLFDSKGRAVSSAFGRVGSSSYVATVMLEPGSYTLKMAAIDAEGRRGSVERQFDAALTTVGGLRMGDLMLAEAAERSGVPTRPAVDRATSARMVAYFEIYPERQNIQAATVQLEVAESDDGEALLAEQGEVANASNRRRVAFGAVPVGLLPPGEYVVRATLSEASRQLARLARRFRVIRPTGPEGTNGGRSSTAVTYARSPLQPLIKPFEKNGVLQPDTLGFFLEQLEAIQGPARTPAFEKAIAHAREGRYDDASKEVKPSNVPERVAAAFFKGLAYYEKGQMQAAGTQFRAAVTANPEFFPALAYLGASFAGSGRDGDAVAAWQTSLSIETEAPPTFELLADALFRIGDGDTAVDVLEEATELWPDNDDFRRQLAAAYAMQGRHRDAFGMLQTYIDRNPKDLEALFLGMRLLYEARLSDDFYQSRDADAQLLGRYAAAYQAAQGPRQGIVNLWVKYVRESTSP